MSFFLKLTTRLHKLRSKHLQYPPYRISWISSLHCLHMNECRALWKKPQSHRWIESVASIHDLMGLKQLQRFEQTMNVGTLGILEILITRRSVPDSQSTLLGSIPVKILSVSLTRGKCPRLGNVNQLNLFLKLSC